MIARGLREADRDATAEAVASDTRRLIGDAGFSEYFNPIDRAGIGGETFSWTAAIDLLLGEEEQG